MTYNPSIPTPTENISVSQGEMLVNFGQLNTQFGIDHTPYYTGSINGNGFHKKVTLLDQTASIPVSAAGQVVIYGKTNNSITMPYYKRDGLTTVFPVSPIKAMAVFTVAGSGVNPTINQQFNITSITCSGITYTVTMSNAMNTTGTNPYGIQVTISDNSNAVITIISPTQFTLVGSTSGATFWTVTALDI